MGNLVFLVGSDCQFFDALGVRLSRVGVTVLRSVSGNEGVRLAAQQPVDLVIAEINLAEMDAIELCRQLRRRRIIAPILVCTDAEAPIEAVLVYEAGADYYFAKAIDWVVLEAKVRSALRRVCWQEVAHQGNNHEELRPNAVVPTTLAQEFGFNALTRFEERLLEVLSMGDGDVVAKPRITAEIWGNSRVAANNLYELVSSLRAKLRSAGWTIGNVRGVGYRLSRQTDSVP